MGSELVTLHFKNREESRTWLTKNHSSSPGIWFVFYKSHTGRKSIFYEDMVRGTDSASLFRRLDSHGEAAGDTRKAHSRIDPVARGSPETWTQIGP
jgi:hypothetical protein